MVPNQSTELSLIPSTYDRLLYHYGHLNWWPADSPFEVMVGAILTQNTSWQNVEKAIHNLRPYLKPEIIIAMEDSQLAELIRPSGFFTVKTRRLKNFLAWFLTHKFSIDVLQKMDIADLRHQLLSINGIGKETADSIILYAVNKPIFVIDAYSRRIFDRLGMDVPKDYDAFRELFENQLEVNHNIYNEYHALIVEHAKQFCRKKPLCSSCFFNDCQYRNTVNL
ncbi:endonuclease [Desulfuribacillus stibiiarsenatis]|uniref:Endonuclease n=1 Tax=Desulfuribacillus stibiiarsenatis TaxID=1390249 RepID=A0A1E5L5G0_9FIRM|nr:endonuclease III domain-containing protein [Desulfuribacillus stibiiarsenatis]OEH85298.1 endonuclease [Desulfuribacillus stibiiarsenatis]